MNTFNKIIFTFFCFLVTFEAVGQPETCDIATNGIVSTPSIMHGSGTSDITFQIINYAGGPCEYPVNSVMVIVTLPATGLGFNSFVSPATGAYFDWSYDIVENIIVGINHSPIGLDEGETVTARLDVLALPSNNYPDCRTIVLDIINNPDGPTFPSNTSDGNDGGYTTITITPTPGVSTVECLDEAVQPTPGFMVPACSSPSITYVDTPPTLTCEGTRVWSFEYSACPGCPYSSFTWTYTYTIDRTIHPVETGGPVPTSSTVNCEADIAAPTLPVVTSSCGETLTPGSAIIKSEISNYFDNALILSPTPAMDAWYTDRYDPAGFSTMNFMGNNTLQHSINASDCEGCRPPAYSSSFYNTQGRKYDVGPSTNYMEIDLFIPADWATSGRRMAGFWGTAVDGGDAVSAYPIIEFTSDDSNPRFRAWINDWVDLGLPAGFVYDNWVTLQIRLLPTGEFLYTVVTDQGNLMYQTTIYSVDNSVRISNLILQGHNTATPGVTYDIYWDNLSWRENYIAPTCNGVVTYTYDYQDCSGLVFPWTFTFNVTRTEHPAEVGGPVSSSEAIACADLVVEPATLPVVLASCGEGPITPETPILQAQKQFDFSTPVVLAPVQTPGAWYTDRYEPFAFTNAVFSGDDRLKHSIDASACDGCRGAQNGAFYNTQGRKYDLGNGTNYMSVNLYIPADWETSDRRMAGFWGTSFDGGNNVSEYPILEFTSDGMNPRFRMWPADPVIGGWVDLGLPAGFAYNDWVNLQIRLLPTGEYLFYVDDLVYQTSNLSGNNSVRIGNVILQGHNTSSPGVTYDIYWDDLIWREDYAAPACQGIATYTYDYIDDCNDLVFPWVYTYEINDNVMPSVVAPTTVDLECATDLPAGETTIAGYLALTGASASDNCTDQGSLLVSFSDVVTMSESCSGVITRTYTITDNCANATMVDHVFTVTDNTTPGVTAPTTMDLECSTDLPAGETTIAGFLALTGAAASDNCTLQGDLQVSFNDVVTVSGSCSGVITRTYTIMDDCGNETMVDHVFTITDNTAPSVTAPATVDIECNTDLPPGETTITGFLALSGSAASDNCTAQGNLQVSFSDVVTVSGNCSGVITRTYTLTDDCGNATMVDHVFTVTDNTLPVITILGDEPTYICYGETYVDDGATALDNCSGDLSGSIITVNPVNTSVAGTYMVTYDVMDACGNSAIQAVRTVIVRPHPTGTISGTATVLQNAPMTPVVTFQGMDGTAPFTFYYSLQFNSDPLTYHWTSPPGNPVTVAQSNAVVGVFTYTLLKVVDVHGCEYDLPSPQPTAVITVISSCDLSPSVPRPINGSFVTGQTKEGVIQFTNAGPGPTSGLLTFRVSNVSNFNIVIPAVSGTYDGLSCQNSVFTVTPGTFFTTLTTNAVIPAGSNLRVGYVNTALGAGGSNGNLTITINNGTGGDNNNANNKSVRTFIIN